MEKIGMDDKQCEVWKHLGRYYLYQGEKTLNKWIELSGNLRPIKYDSYIDGLRTDALAKMPKRVEFDGVITNKMGKSVSGNPYYHLINLQGEIRGIIPHRKVKVTITEVQK